MIKSFANALSPNEIVTFRVEQSVQDKHYRNPYKILSCNCQRSLLIKLYTEKISMKKDIFICCQKQMDALHKLLPTQPKKLLLLDKKYKYEAIRVLFDTIWFKIDLTRMYGENLFDIMQYTWQAKSLEIVGMNSKIFEFCIIALQKNVHKIIISDLCSEQIMRYLVAYKIPHDSTIDAYSYVKLIITNDEFMKVSYEDDESDNQLATIKCKFDDIMEASETVDPTKLDMYENGLDEIQRSLIEFVNSG